jgi:hypothetical protein
MRKIRIAIKESFFMTTPDAANNSDGLPSHIDWSVLIVENDHHDTREILHTNF